VKATPPESSSPPPPADRPPAETPAEAPPQAAPAPPKPAAWPDWFRAADGLLAALVLVGAFLATSFSIRNSDYWLHLAGGRLLASGQYPIGGDPFSYTGAGRVWVNSSWLFDLGAYAVQSADPSGSAAVALKAAAFAAAFGLPFALRRAGYALWPWAGAAAVGALASAGFVTVRPVAVSMLFLAVTLLLIYRGPWQRGAWRAPVLLAVLFAVWANFDRWFLLGPLTVLLVLIGEKFDRFLTRGSDPGGGPGDPFPPAPPAAGLVRAFVLGVVACLLNPMFLAALVKSPIEAVTQLFPWELGFGLPAGAAGDPEFAALARSGWGQIEQLFSTTSAGVALNGVALLLLFLGGLAALVADFARLRATHILLWVVFGALALQSAWLVPYFAIISVPLIAGHLNGLSSRLELGPRAEPRTRLLLAGSSLGRLLSIAVVLLGVAAAYPGWLHPSQSDPVYGEVYTRPVEWAVQPDAGMVRTAKLLHDLRAGGSLDEARGLNTSVDLANYCAWFAPAERVFADGRYVFHRTEWPNFLTVRRVVYGRRTPTEDVPDPDELWRVCDARDIGYLAVAVPSYQTGGTSLFLSPLFQILQREDRWALWHLDGRSEFVGRFASVPPSRATVERLHFDPARLAFGPAQEPVPEGRLVLPPPVPAPGWDEFVASYIVRRPPPPAEADDAHTLAAYAGHLGQRARQRWFRELGWRKLVRGALGGPMLALLYGEDEPIADVEYAVPILAVRAARRAVAAAPDRPEPYYALATAYRMRQAPVGDFPMQTPMEMPEPVLQVLTAQTRTLARVPPPERCGTGGAIIAAREWAQLAATYAQMRQLDLTRDAVQRAIGYAERLTPDTARGAIVPEVLQVLLPRQKLQPALVQLQRADRPGAEWVKLLKEIDDQFGQLVRQRTERVQRGATPLQRFQLAIQAELPGMALQVFESAESASAFGGESEQMNIAIAAAMLQLRAGRLAGADATLTALGEGVRVYQARHPRENVTRVYQALVGLALRLEGNFTAAAESFNAAAPPDLPPALRRLANVPLLAIRVSGAVAGATVIAPTFEQRLQVQNVLKLEAAYQYDRAMLALCDADIPEARRRLEKAARPQGVDLARLGDPAGLVRIKRYLDLTRQYGGQ
jgi:hypothetical protein